MDREKRLSVLGQFLCLIICKNISSLPRHYAASPLSLFNVINHHHQNTNTTKTTRTTISTRIPTPPKLLGEPQLAPKYQHHQNYQDNHNYHQHQHHQNYQDNHQHQNTNTTKTTRRTTTSTKIPTTATSKPTSPIKLPCYTRYFTTLLYPSIERNERNGKDNLNNQLKTTYHKQLSNCVFSPRMKGLTSTVW